MDAADWWSIEVMDAENAEHAEVSAAAWRDAYGQVLAESLVTNGATRWEWYPHSWGVVLEVAFPAEESWWRWRSLPGTCAALDAVPDPLAGLLVHRGHGGASGSYVPRGPRIAPAADRVELPEPSV
ncbi:hypothetical protein RVR_2514 [Actinacidiphila reveromycinica]|uniref:Uncharacterized protein n=1 Tax=Actinacidiphila reveromycinica TaxID=659352 RepID=A0A7U3UQT0_9ACTN|nr:hypothetical protein [Streptomyces sp. SN-593]BBA96976.1 hypothetical protein RVR_2514 [Streptomyces sp. SN-593]